MAVQTRVTRINVDPEALGQTIDLVNNAHQALSALILMLDGVDLDHWPDPSQMRRLLMPINTDIYGALDELTPMKGQN